MSDGVVVKKVKAYPIEAKLSVPQGEFQVAIAKLENVGFYVESPDLILPTGAKGKIVFGVPVQNILVQADVILVKNVDSYIKPGSGKNEVLRLLEFHFMNLAPDFSKHISEFKTAIGQK